MTDNTEPTIEQKISDIIASYLVLATDNGQPYIQYDDTAVDKITNLISDQVAKARIEAVDYYAWRFDCNTVVSELYGWRDTLERAKEQTLRHFDATLNGVKNK